MGANGRIRIGADVYYVIDHGRSLGERCAAKITRVIDEHRVNLRLFTDAPGPGLALKDEFKEAVAFNLAGHAGTWHWPEE